MVGATLLLLAAMVVTMAPVTGSTWGPRVTDVAWNRLTEEFVLQLEAPRSALFPPPMPTYTFETAVVDTTVEVFVEGRSVAVLNPPPHPVETRPGALQTQDRYVPITPQRVPWDRNAGTITGEVTLKIQAQIVWINNPNRPASPATFTEWGLLLV